MQIEKQRTDADCAVCCFAMLTGRTYEDVVATIGDAYDPGNGVRRDQEALKRLGFEYGFKGDFIQIWHEPLMPSFFRRFAWGRRALMSVPSLNFSGLSHMIYFDGANVRDPSRLRTYTKFEELEPTEITIFREPLAIMARQSRAAAQHLHDTAAVDPVAMSESVTI